MPRISSFVFASSIFAGASAASNGNIAVEFPSDFFFGVATAPAQSEDLLDDQWAKFAKAGNVPAWKDINRSIDRLNFWSHPEVEIGLAKETNSEVFRMGVDWTRLYPAKGQFNVTAMKRYVEIVNMVRDSGLKVMLTLFHHSIPEWTNEFGGWTNQSIFEPFEQFTHHVVEFLGDKVDYWNTFNEAFVFASLTYCAGLWPPGPQKSTVDQLKCMLPGGDFDIAMRNMATAHNNFAQFCKTQPQVYGKMGVAHNVGHNVAHMPWDYAMTELLSKQTKFPFIDMIQDNLDFLGINYYGREIIAGTAPAILPEWEYSESGRCVDPQGLYMELHAFWDRYKSKVESIIITENGISDATDILRPSYMAEHFVAIQWAIRDGVKVSGYIHWTVSDNWEWVDGYCPKFGMCAVDRSNPDMPRIKRPSFNLYAEIAKTKQVTWGQRDAAWELIANAVATNSTRPFCRGSDGKSSLDVPVQRSFSHRDWRVNDPQVVRPSTSVTSMYMV